MTDLPEQQASGILESEKAMRVLGIGREDYGMILSAAIGEMRDRIARVGEALRRGRLDEVALHAHTLKSASGSIGAERLRGAAERLLLAAREQDEAASAAEAELTSVAFDDVVSAARGD